MSGKGPLFAIQPKTPSRWTSVMSATIVIARKKAIAPTTITPSGYR